MLNTNMNSGWLSSSFLIKVIAPLLILAIVFILIILPLEIPYSFSVPGKVFAARRLAAGSSTHHATESTAASILRAIAETALPVLHSARGDGRAARSLSLPGEVPAAGGAGRPRERRGSAGRGSPSAGVRFAFPFLSLGCLWEGNRCSHRQPRERG